MRLLVLAAAFIFSPGCTWMQQQMAGEGFQPWSDSMGKTTRNTTSDDAPKHSGFFFDRKAQQIEESLGGGF